MNCLFMVALCNRADHIYFHPVVSFLLLLLFFPRLISAVGDWMFTIHLHMACANLECRSETCCTRLAANTGRKKVAKNRHLGTIAQLCRAISSQVRHVSTIGKNLLSSNISSTCPHNMVNFRPLVYYPSDSLVFAIVNPCIKLAAQPIPFQKQEGSRSVERSRDADYTLLTHPLHPRWGLGRFITIHPCDRQTYRLVDGRTDTDGHGATSYTALCIVYTCVAW